MKKYYFDTSIWLDLLENRNEPNFPKGEWAQKLVEKIIENDGKIIYSDNNIVELINLGHEKYEIAGMFEEMSDILIFVESTEKEINGANDLCHKESNTKKRCTSCINCQRQ